MKYLITESKLDSIILQYLDNQDFIQIEKSNSIYFANSESDEDAQVRYVKEDGGWCYIYDELVKEISTFFSIERPVSKKVIGRWVENTLQMKVTGTRTRAVSSSIWLSIPK